MTEQETAQEKIQLVLGQLTAAEVDQLAPDSGEFQMIAEAVMAWYALLMASGIVKKTKKAQTVLASSMVVLGTLVKYSYALGRRRERGDGVGTVDQW